MSQARPLLSFCVTGRNDDYFGDYKYRVSTCLNLLCKGLDSLGKLDRAEIIISDWGSERPLAKDLRLSRLARQTTRFLHTPPEVAGRIHDDSILPNGLATNVAFRRGQGEFLSYWDSDTLLDHSSVKSLLDVLEGKVPRIDPRQVLWFANRRHLPMGIVKKKPSVLEIEEYLNRNAAYLAGETMGPGYGAGSCMMMHRDLAFATNALDQRMRWWGWTDVDMALRLNQRYPTLELNNFGVLAVHQEHYTSRLTEADKELTKRKFNLPTCTAPFTLNDANWGLVNEPLVFMQGEHESEELPDRTDRIGTTEPWSLTQAELIRQIMVPQIQEVIAPVGKIIAIDSRELPALQTLAWYGMTQGVITFVELGLRLPQAICTVVRSSPGAEVHGIHAFINRSPGPETLQSTMVCNYFDTMAFQCIVSVRHFSASMCYLRWTGGDPKEAVGNLSRSAAGRFAYDLALIRCGPSQPYGPEQAVELSKFLRPGGMIVVLGETPQAFQTTFNALMQANPHLGKGFLFSDGVTGFLLSAVLAG